MFAQRLLESRDRTHHVRVRVSNRLFAVQRLHQTGRGAEQRHHEAGVAPAGTEARRLGFENRNLEARVGGFQMVCSRQPRVAAANDRHVCGDVANGAPVPRRTGPGSASQ